MVVKGIEKKDILKILVILTLLSLVLMFSGIAADDYDRGDCNCDLETCEGCCYENDYDDDDSDGDDDDEDVECYYDTDCSGSKTCNSLNRCIDRDDGDDDDDDDSSLCTGRSDTSATGSLVITSAATYNKYVSSVTILACKNDISFDIYLKGSANFPITSDSVEDGSDKTVGDDRNIDSSEGVFSQVCIEVHGDSDFGTDGVECW